VKYILLFNLLLSVTTIPYSLYITLKANRIDKDLSHSCNWILTVNACAFGYVLNQVISGFIPYQTPSLTLIAIAYYIAQLCAAIHAYRFYRKKEK
jgi:hypothetical protein